MLAQHDYEKDLNGKGKTMLMRTNLLPDNVGWGSKNADVSWENEPTLRNWLENTYAKRLSEAALKTIVPVTIRYSYGSNSSGTLKDQRFFIPTADEFNQFPGGKTFWERSFSGGRENATVNANGWDVYDIWHYSFACRNAKTGDDPSNSDNKNCWGYIEGVGVRRGQGADPGDPGHITTYLENDYEGWDWETAYTTIYERLKGKRVRFALEDNPSHYYEGLLWVNQFKSDKGHSKITLEYRLHPTMYTLKVEAVALNVYELKLNKGMEYQLLVGVGPVNTFYRRVNVTATPKNVVKITQNGTILALKKGTAVVTAECGGVKAECSVTVGEFETCTIERDLHGVVETNPVGSVVKDMSYQNVFTVADTENFTLALTAMRLEATIASGEDGSMNVTEEWVPVDAGCIVTAKDGTSAEFKMGSVKENIKITANAAAKPVAAMLCADILPVEVKPLKQADGRFRLET